MRARGAQAQTGAHARRASDDRRAREVRKQGLDARACARARPTRARANKLSKGGFGELICDLESLFARAESLFARARVGWARARTRARTRARIFALLAHLARASICSRVSRARACRCSRTSRAHVLNARALALRTPQLVRHHI